jgi:hypothetical protein
MGKPFAEMSHNERLMVLVRMGCVDSKAADAVKMCEKALPLCANEIERFEVKTMMEMAMRRAQP